MSDNRTVTEPLMRVLYSAEQIAALQDDGVLYAEAAVARLAAA